MLIHLFSCITTKYSRNRLTTHKTSGHKGERYLVLGDHINLLLLYKKIMGWRLAGQGRLHSCFLLELLW